MIAVTGATGHIGNVVIRELLAAGWQTKAIVPPGEDISPLKNLDVEIVEGDVRNYISLLKAFAGVETVYHLAGIVTILPGKRKLLEEVNVRGSRNVAEACLEAGVGRLVYTSSIHALKEPPEGTVITESQPYDPVSVTGDYARSKARATLEVLKVARKGLDAVIVCPTGVIGPFDYKGSEMGCLVRGFLDRKIRATIDGAYDFVDVRDVARGMLLAAARGRSGEGYILSGERITVSQLMKLLEKTSGIRAPGWRVPCRLARFFGVLATPYYLLSGSRPLFTAYSIDVLSANSLVSSAKASRELGYSARSIRESVADTVSWFESCRGRKYKAGKTGNILNPV
ncbi:MAG: SDR family oxidoreductase [Dehalococcoidales bacterium]|nr:SDR family oxidoreductase [Dehalococcoidales bacterium]